jgi:hypothetical protein
MRSQLAELRKVCESEGRNYDDIELTSVWEPKGGEDSLKVLVDLGIDRAVVMFGGPDAIKMIGDKFIQ